ncbi:uncharacterized protein LOC132950736 [Metopolophium dirhodum]|uniref:uncharacterized protein LOC132950736 n=1 Tax=Metopolophium dirhodum TaxID=44670 RepID=UPI00298F62F9|nr:uncharacterized protein LOC132950736 [Metopolophium dirhodum]
MSQSNIFIGALKTQSETQRIKPLTIEGRQSNIYYVKDRRFTAAAARVKKNIFSHGPDEDYGAVEQPSEIVDMPIEEYRIKKTEFLKKLKLTNEEIKLLERSTINQSQIDEWRRQRKMRLTASNFGKVARLRSTTSRENTVKFILYDLFRGNAATKYGIQNKPLAKNNLESKLGTAILPCGLFVDNNLPFLAASPDGLISYDSIVEIKCPSSIKDYTPEEAFHEKKLKCMTHNDGNLQLKTSHAYFYQIQGQLHITNRKFCYFCIWTPKGLIVEKIERDDKFWMDIEPKLKKFYMECLLPEIIDSRLDRGLPLRTGL